MTQTDASVWAVTYISLSPCLDTQTDVSLYSDTDSDLMLLLLFTDATIIENWFIFRYIFFFISSNSVEKRNKINFQRLNFVDVATGSLGQGLSCAAGMAYTGKYFDKAPYRVYCMIGDGESAEGSIWEALSFAGHYKLDNMVAIFDVNRLGQSEPTALGHDVTTYQKRVESFGWVLYKYQLSFVWKKSHVFYKLDTYIGHVEISDKVII